jgi:hypothetical protein
VDLEDLRLAVYRSFAETGTVPGIEGLADLIDAKDDEVETGLRQLARDRHVALAENDDASSAGPRVAMAHPFSAVPLGFSVMGPRTLWWGGCAWDSFALPHLVPDAPEVLVATQCPACGRPHAWNVTRTAPPDGDQVAHFMIPAAAMWVDVVHTCAHQRLFCSPDCVDAWLEESGTERGYVLDLATLWRLAAHWYDGRLDRGYVRRDPATAADYLRGVGLSGAFWGL